MKTRFVVSIIRLCAAGALLLAVGTDPAAAAGNDSKPPQFIYVGGEVKVPQRYIYTGDLTLGDAIKMAKGVTAKASEKVTLTRQGADAQTFSLKAVQSGDAKDIKLKPGDKIFVARKD
jgi:protein involved in polysaccharide export with SLBB domain